MLDIIWAIEQPTPPEKWLHFIGGSIESRAWLEWKRAHPPKPSRYKRVSRQLRAAIIDRDGYWCGLCGGAVEPDDVDVDHVLPFSKGGAAIPENLRVTHSSCNRKRGNRLDEYR
jgi:5-methylcytosine-specific restriction endonuclease McrA